MVVTSVDEGEAARSTTDLGKTALSTILGQPTEYEGGLVEEVLAKVAVFGDIFGVVHISKFLRRKVRLVGPPEIHAERERTTIF